jgi:hypothetical protein
LCANISSDAKQRKFADCKTRIEAFPARNNPANGKVSQTVKLQRVWPEPGTVGLARACPSHTAPHPALSAVCRSLRLCPLCCRFTAQDSRSAWHRTDPSSHRTVASSSSRYISGLHFLATVPGEPRAAEAELFTIRDTGGSPQRTVAAGGTGEVCAMWPVNVCRIPWCSNPSDLRLSPR